MHKKIIALCVGIGLIVAIGIALLTQQKDTYARVSNQDFLDDGFWANNPNAAAIGNALYDNGTNPTAYTQHWQGSGCVGTPTVVQVSGATIPSPMNVANTVYVLEPGTYTAPASVVIGADCVAILGSGNVQLQGINIMVFNNRSRIIIDNIDMSQSAANGISFSQSSNLTVNNVSINDASLNGIHLHISQNIHIRNVDTHTNQFDGILLEDVTNSLFENINSYDNGANGGGGYDVNDFEINNYTLSNNGAMGLDAGDWHSGYVYSGIAEGNQIGILLDNSSTQITIDQIQAHTNDSYGLAIVGSDTSYNTIQHAQSYYNGSGGVALMVTSGNALQDVYAYNNVDHGILVHNSTSNTLDDIVTQDNNRGIELNGDSANNIFYNVQSFDNTQQGILVDTANYNYFDYIQVYNNQIGFHIFEGQDNYVNNIVGYNNSTAGVDISGKGVRRNAFNNSALFNNMYGVYFHTVTSLDEVSDSIFNNAVLFNNNYGLYMNETNNGIIDENNFHNISIYNNDRGVYSNGANVADNAYHGYFDVFGNALNLFGTNGSDPVLTAGPSVPAVGWNSGALTQSITFTMTCNWGIQATNTLGGDLLTYPHCAARGPQVWAGSPDVKYTFFPEIAKQVQPVIWISLNLQTYGSYEPDMFVGDLSYLGSNPFGGHIALDESNQFTYQSGGFTYRNTTGFDILMTINNNGPANYLITGVNNITYDGVPTSIIGALTLFPTYIFNPFSLPLQNGLWITRVGYDTVGYESNYYGFIRGLNMDDDISIQKTANSGTVIVGTQIGFTITITNSGSADAGFSQVLDPIPAGINTGTLVADPVGVYSGDINTYIWDIPVVSGNTTYTFVITGTVLAGYTGSEILNTGWFISDQTSNDRDWIISDDDSVDVFIPVAGTCGTAAGNAHYGQNTLNSGTIDLCGQGISSGFTGPNINGGYSWMCLGSYGGASRPCSADENRCGDGGVNTGYSEQCDDSNMNSADGCSNTCQLEYPSCTITANPSYQLGQFTTFTLGRSGYAQPNYLDFGNGTGVAGSGNILLGMNTYTYPAAGVYTATLEIYNPLNPTYTGSCNYQITITGVCGNAIEEPGEDCDLGSGVNGNGTSGCSTLCTHENPSCTINVSPIRGYAPLDVNVVGTLGANSSLVSIAYGDGQTGYSLNTNHVYTSVGTFTPIMIVQNPLNPNITAQCISKVDTLPLTCNDINFSLAPSTGTVPFPVTGSFAMLPTGYVATGINRGDGNTTANPVALTNYGNMYTNTGFYYSTLLIENTLDSGFNMSCSLPVGAGACGDTGTIDIGTLEISVVKRVQNNGVTVFPNGLVPYIIEVTNTSTGARLDNVTIVDLISDNMEIGSYFFEYNGTIYSGVVNSGYFVIDDTLLPITLDPLETIEIVVYATMDPGQGLQGNNYAFAGGDWVPLSGSLCTSSGSTPTCSRNPNSPAVSSVSGWSSYNGLINSVGFNPNDFTVCAETTQGAPTAPGSMGTPSDPSVVIDKTLIDGNGIPTNQVVMREDTTFLLDIDFTNMYPHTINWNNFSLTDYFSGGIGISGWHIVDIQTASGVSVPRTTGSNEYNIDLSGLYAPNVYTPTCQTFTWTPANHTPGCWTNEPFGSPQASYLNCLPQAATDSGYQYMQRYTVTGAGLDGIQFYPGVNDQWFGGSAVWSFFDTQPHTAMLCQTPPVGIVIDQIDTLQLIITAQVTEPTLAGQGPVCNEAGVSYAGTGDIDDACFDLTIPQYCALMIQPDFVIAAYDTVPSISGGVVNGSILSDMTLTSTTTSVNPIVSYQWDIYSSGSFGMMNSPYTFDNSLIISGQGTPSIELNFAQYMSDGTRPFIWVTLTVTDTMGYQSEYTTPLFRSHDNGGQYRVAGNAITGSSITGYTLNMTGEMLSSATDPIIPSNELWWSDSGLAPTMAGIDRYNVGTNDEFFPYIGAYNYSNLYSPGVHTLNLNTHIGDINQNYPLGDRTYPVACSVSCGNGVIEGVEQCDDTNTNPGDGCSDYCQIESGRICTGQPSVCTLIPPYCGDGIPQNVTGGTTTGTIDYVVSSSISLMSGFEIQNYGEYPEIGLPYSNYSGQIQVYQAALSTGTALTYQWSFSGYSSGGVNTGFIIGSTTGSTVSVFDDAMGYDSDLNGILTVTITDAAGNIVTTQSYVDIDGDTSAIIGMGVATINITGSQITYSDYEVYVSSVQSGGSTIVTTSGDRSMLFGNSAAAAYDRLGDGIYDYAQQGTPQVVSHTYTPNGQSITTDVSFFFSGFAMNMPILQSAGAISQSYAFHTTVGQATSGYQEICDDGNSDDYDGCTAQCQLTDPQCQMILVSKLDPSINYQRAYPIWTGSTGMVIQLNTSTIGSGLSYQWDITPLDLTAVYGAQFSGSSTGTTASIFVSADTLSGGSSFPDFSLQAGVTISNGLMTGYVDGIVICTQNGACGFTSYSYNFNTGSLQGFTVNGSYNFTTYMQSINQTTPSTSASLTGITINQGGGNYYLGIYDTGTFIRYTGPANGQTFAIDSGATYDTIPFQLSGGGMSFNNTIGVSYYNTCLGGSYCGDTVIDYNDKEACDAGQNNGQPNSGCSIYCQIASVSCNIIGFPLAGNAPLTVSLAMNPRTAGSYFNYGNGVTGTTASYTYSSGGSYNIVGYTPHPSSGSIMIACPLPQQINVYGQSCTNGATNYPTCNQCGTGQYYCSASQQCIATGSTCAGCTNGATNYPTCNQCGTGQYYCSASQQCIATGSTCAGCTNGATNYPTCNQCGTGQTYCSATQQCIGSGSVCGLCANGGTNPPTCNVCGLGQYYCAASQQCIATGSTCAGCTNGATNYPACNQCGTGQFYCNASNSCKNTGQSCGGGGGGSSLVTDYCPGGDFSDSYYDKQCGAPVHSSAPVGKFCIYDDEEYLARGSFDDIFGHWGELPIEVMRVSCLHRGRHTKAGLRRYEPNGNIQRDEVLKTLVKIVGIEFEDFTIKSEELLYNGVIPFGDVSKNNWFSHYASYAFSKGLTEGLYTTNASKNYLSPTTWMTRYEATKAIVIAYEKIHGTILPQGASPSKITDVPVADPNYIYVRKAEVAGLVQGYPQKNGTFIFKGKGSITRAEFAKIIAAAFGEQLIDVDQVVVTSTAYNMILQSLQKVKGDKLTFVRNLFEKMKLMDDTLFLQKFKVQKDLFIKTLADKVLLPMIQK